MPRSYSDKRRSGLSPIGVLPWGSHICQFYESQEDLLEILVPYFKAGLANNECCVYVAREPLANEEARRAFRANLRCFDERASKGQVEIIPVDQWLAMGARSGRAIVSMLEKAISRGFDGLRLAGHAIPSGKDGGKDFICHGSDVIGRYNVIGLFAYPRNRFDATGLMDVVKRHRYALVRNETRWEAIESSEARIIKDALNRSEEKLQSLFHNMSEGFAYQRVILDDSGAPCDYIFLQANRAFEKLTGLKVKNIIGKRATEVFPGIEADPMNWIGKYGRVALTGRPVQFESYSVQLKKWFSVSAFSPHKGFFAVTFSNITERKQAEAEIHRRSTVLEGINKILAAALTCRSEEELGVACLEVAEKLTQSSIGFIGEINDISLQGIAISNPGWDYCKVIDPSGHHRPAGHFKIHGIYGRVILDGKGFFANDPARHPDHIELPAGHPPLESFLGVPLIREGHTIGMIALGNRPGGYRPEEQQALEALTPAIVEAFMRKRAEDQLRKAHDELEQKVFERTEELRKTNRILRMISECNQILVRVADENDLVREICRAIVEIGCYRMAWVGYADNDKGKTVRPVASRGFEDGYLSSIRISWADNAPDRSPTGSCIRTGEICIEENLLENSALYPWRVEELKRGYRSSIALPLMSGGKPFGSLTIFSEDPGTFDKGQSMLLRELADDLAFGIVALRAQKERDQARRTAEKRAEQLQALAAELVEAEQRERRRLAQILHDHLQQLLVGAKFGASLIHTKAKEEEIGETAGELCSTLDEAIRASRSLSADLSPPVLHEKGLTAGLEWLGRQMEQKHGLIVEISADSAAEPAAEQIRLFLFEAVRELLLNIVKYARVERAQVRMRRLDSGETEVIVADAGIGFDPALLEGRASTTGGFGLFSIRERLGYFGGRMRIDSAPDKGSRFMLVTPSQLAPSPATKHFAAGAKSISAPDTASLVERDFLDMERKIRVLIADDHPVMRQGLTRLLQEEPDIEVVGEAGDGLMAVDLVRQLKPDVVLMDVSLPLINGFDATRQIISEFPAVRVIGLSMHEETDMASAMRRAGAVEYLTKGGPIERLIAAIRAQREGTVASVTR